MVSKDMERNTWVLTILTKLEGFKNRFDIENRWWPILLKTEKTGWFLVWKLNSKFYEYNRLAGRFLWFTNQFPKVSFPK
jgi:hypothetical protein